jgi:uncharacterized protein YdcH (DUF465 family)
MSDLNSQERERLISMYITQYNQTNSHIARLFDTLDSIRNNINTLIGNTNNLNTNSNTNARANNLNTNSNTNARANNLNTNSNTNANRSAHSNRQPSSSSRSPVYYDYSNPIERSTYITEAENITDLITTFLSSSVPVRPTQEQINSASRLVRFGDIQTPNSTICAISLEPFALDDNVRQLSHCSHIFFPDQFNQWFQNNVKCPVCRHDIRALPTTTASATTATTTTTTTTLDLSNNEFVTNLLTIFNPNTSDVIPENQLIYETIIQALNTNL